MELVSAVLMIERKAKVEWRGGLKQGRGTLTTESSALKGVPYSFSTRFENEPGTNPEELIGAAHAGCFSMALAGELEKAGFTPQAIQSSAKVMMGKNGAGWSIQEIHIDTQGAVPEIDQARFEAIAKQAKENCPVSRVLRAKIFLNATLVQEERIQKRAG